MDVFGRARQWAQDDIDPADRAEIEALIDAGDAGELGRRFAGDVEFGTAGLRGVVGAGQSRMNRAVVVRATAGVVRWAGQQVDQPVVVIAHDARHGSAQFAQDAAAVVAACGGRAVVVEGNTPTPVLAFSVQRLGADVGIMVTASHNPREYNGYKVYVGARLCPQAPGAQIVSPMDAEISRWIAQAEPACRVPYAEPGTAEWLDRVTVAPSDLVEQYVAAVVEGVGEICGQVCGPTPRIVYSATHGVGADVLEKVFAAAGFDDVHAVQSQREPDPDFPLLPSPNPESAAVMDEAVRLGHRVCADLIVVVDPDADRCAVALPYQASVFIWPGDDVGWVLGDYVGSRYKGRDVTLARSIVSSQMLDDIAGAYGVGSAVTLTGFKWISRAPKLRFGYEEAIGYCPLPEVVRDKDGIATALLIAMMVRDCASRGWELWDVRDRLYLDFGVHHTTQFTLPTESPQQGEEMVRRVMKNLGTGVIAGTKISVTGMEDMSEGVMGLPPTTGVRAKLEVAFEGSALPLTGWFVLRPSGTEPKVKVYTELVFPRQPEDPEVYEPGLLRKELWARRMQLDEVATDIESAIRSACMRG